MFKRNSILILTASLAMIFANNAVGQSNKQTTKKTKPSLDGSTDGIGIRRKNPERISPTRLNGNDATVSNLMKGHEGQQERNGVSGNTTGRKGTRKIRNFSSTTQPHADGILSKTKKTMASRKRPTKSVLNLEQTNGGLDTTDEAPAFGSAELKARSRQSVRGRKTTSRKKPKNTLNLLPYAEQTNIYRKRKQN